MSTQETGSQFNISMKPHSHCILWTWCPSTEHRENDVSPLGVQLSLHLQRLPVQRSANLTLFLYQMCLLDGISDLYFPKPDALLLSQQIQILQSLIKPIPASSMTHGPNILLYKLYLNDRREFSTILKILGLGGSHL